MTSDQFTIWAIGVICGLVIYYFLIRFVFDIDKRNRLLKAQIELLARIALKQGVSHDEVETIQRNSEKTRYK